MAQQRPEFVAHEVSGMTDVRKLVDERIVVDPKLLGGKPVVRGTGIAVELVLERLARNLDVRALLRSNPPLTADDVKACLAYAQALVEDDVLAVAHRVLVLEGALEAGATVPLPDESYGVWPWLRVFDRDDLGEFVRSMREAIIMAYRGGSSGVIKQTLDDWQVTAQAMQDPVERAALLRPFDEAEYVEVHRPE
jgi:uncharacterized protein (DUF433 family)